MVKTSDLRGKWEYPVWTVKAKGYIDPCPLWDDDGNAYLYSYATEPPRGRVTALFTMLRFPTDEVT